MRLSDLTDLQLQKLADTYREIGSRMIDPAIFEELIDRRAHMTSLRALEASLAYERAAGVIESHSLVIRGDGDLQFYDLESCDLEGEDLQGEMEYLDSRKLLIRHPENSHWVAIRDEAEA